MQSETLFLEESKEDIFKLSSKSELKIGEKICGSYSTDFNISWIHLIIRDVFSYHIRRKDDEKFTENKWIRYCSRVKDILEEYDRVTTYKKSKKIVIGIKKFTSGEDSSCKLESDLNKRLSLIRRFLNIAKDYIEVDVLFQPPYEIGCDKCDLNIDNMTIDEENGVYICGCNSIFGSVYSMETSYIDPDKIDVGTKISYDDRTNFIRRLRSYQGFPNRKISEDFIDFLDKHMQDKYKIPPASEIRKMPTDKYGHRGEMTSVALLKEALRETNNSIHFQDINIICYELWGWECPNIEHLIPKIMEDYKRTQEVYKRLNPSFSSINVELRLYWHLRIAGHDCLLQDFKIPQSRESKKRNSDIFKKMCEETGLEFFPII